MHAQMVVDMSYNAPSTEQFKVVSQSGPKWMINLVLKKLMESEQESMEPKNHESVQITDPELQFQDD